MKIEWTDGAKQDMVRLFSRNPIYSVPRFFDNLYYKCKWGLQRMFRGYDDMMVFGFHSEITDLIIPVLKAIKDDKHGVPFMEEVGGNMEDDNIELHEKAWHQKLDTMISGFEAARRLDCADNWDPEEKNIEKKRALDAADYKRFEEGMDALKKYFFTLWT